MEWRDEVIILGSRPHGEKNQIITTLSAIHGLSRGIWSPSKTQRHIDPGTVAHARWWSRLATHLGRWQLEPKLVPSIFVWNQAIPLACLHSACAMVATCAPPQEPAPTVYALLLNFIEDIMHNPVDKIAVKYVHFERILLEIMGFGLSLDYCVATGDTTDLTYISPKSGRAVSTAAAQPYKHKLLPLPQCLKTEATPLYFSEFVVALETLGYFWQHHALPTALPSARLLLIEFLTRNAA